MYYNIGKILEEDSSWENKFIYNVSMELKLLFSNLKGFSVRNLKYMKAFYNEYKDDEEFVQLVAQLPITVKSSSTSMKNLIRKTNVRRN